MLAATPRAWRLPREHLLLERLAWLTPLLVVVLVRWLPELRMYQLLAAMIGALLVTALHRRPAARAGG